MKADVSNPESYEDLVELLVPVLQQRGIMWDDYTVPGGTYRENLLSTPGHSNVPEGHPARNFRYDVLKEKYGDEHRDIFIDRRSPTMVNGTIEHITNGVKEGVAVVSEKFGWS